MKKLVFILATVAIFGCDNELDLVEAAKSTPIVYGLLSPDDDNHYIRVEKGFIDENISALDIALIPDSLYYSNIDVQIERISTGTLYPLTEVDGDAEGLPRRTGVFAQSPNILYKISSQELNLQELEAYKLIINRNDNSPPITAETTIVGETSFFTPNPFGSLSVKFNNSVDFKWEGGDFAELYNVNLEIHIDERDKSVTTDFQEKIINWSIGQNITNNSIQNNKVEYNFDGHRFFNVLVENLEPSSDLERRLLYFDLIITSAGGELKDYVSVGQANLGLTSTQDIPTKTNLSEGRGLFSSRNESILQGLTLKPESFDSLLNGSITRSLNFIE